MRFTITTASLLTVISTVLAQHPNPFNNPSSYAVTAGKPLALSWQPTTSGSVTLVLRSGSANDLATGTIITSNAQNSGSYTWAVPSDITKGYAYTVEIIDDTEPSNVNYTPYFAIDSTDTTASSTGVVSLGAPSALPVVPASLATAASMNKAQQSSAMSAASMGSMATSAGSMTTSASSMATSGSSASPSSASNMASMTASSTSAASTLPAATGVAKDNSAAGLRTHLQGAAAGMLLLGLAIGLIL